MNPTIMQEIGLLKDFLSQPQDIGIVIGNHQNLDTYASALALYLTLLQAGKKVQIISKKEPTVEFSGLVGIDKVKENFSGNISKLVVSLPYIKGEVEKVLFTEAPNFINFHLTASPDKAITQFSLNDVKLTWEGGAPEAIIVLGVGNIEELSLFMDVTNAKIVNIDNYAQNTRFGNIVLVDEGFSSLSEIVAKVIRELKLPIDIDIAQNILDGVLFATKNFTKQSTSPLAFEAASSAMYVGAKRKGEIRQPAMQEQQPIMQEERRDNRGQQNRRQRIPDNDFPAMHMQNRGQQSQNSDNRRINTQRPQDNRGFFPHEARQNRGQQPYPQNTSDIDALMQKIKTENIQPSINTQFDNRNSNQGNFVQEVSEKTNTKDVQIAPEPQMTPPVENVQMPEEQSFTAHSNEEIPDDWLMPPKVFKSSKNNN